MGAMIAAIITATQQDDEVTTNDGRRISLDAARREQTDYTETWGRRSPFLPADIAPYTDDDDPWRNRSA